MELLLGSEVSLAQAFAGGVTVGPVGSPIPCRPSSCAINQLVPNPREMLSSASSFGYQPYLCSHPRKRDGGRREGPGVDSKHSRIWVRPIWENYKVPSAAVLMRPRPALLVFALLCFPKAKAEAAEPRLFCGNKNAAHPPPPPPPPV